MTAKLCAFCGVGPVEGRRRVYCSGPCADLGNALHFWQGEIRRMQPQMIRADRQLERLEIARGLRAQEVAAAPSLREEEKSAAAGGYPDPRDGTEERSTRIAHRATEAVIEEVTRAHLEALRRLRRAVDARGESGDEAQRQLDAMAKEIDE